MLTRTERRRRGFEELPAPLRRLVGHLGLATDTSPGVHVTKVVDALQTGAAAQAETLWWGLRADDVRGTDHETLRMVCRRGDLNALKFMRARLGFTRQDAIASQALCEAASNGHLRLVRYLHTEFQLTLGDDKAENRTAVAGAVENGHIHVLRYFICEMGEPGDVPLDCVSACARWSRRSRPKPTPREYR